MAKQKGFGLSTMFGQQEDVQQQQNVGRQDNVIKKIDDTQAENKETPKSNLQPKPLPKKEKTPLAASKGITKQQSPKSPSKEFIKRETQEKLGEQKQKKVAGLNEFTLYARVPHDFVHAIKLYCIENESTEKDLVYKSVAKAIGYDEHAAQGLKGEKWLKSKAELSLPFVYGKFNKEFKKVVERYCLEHKCTKQGLVAQAIADQIGY